MKLSIPILICFWILFPGCTRKTNNKINGSFEQLKEHKMPIGWACAQVLGNQKSQRVVLDSTEVMDGKYSMSLSNNNNEREFTSITHVEKGTLSGHLLELKGFMKTEKVSKGFAGLWLRLDGAEGMLAMENMQNQAIAGTNDWKEYTVSLPYDEINSTKIAMGALIVGNGRIWVDDLRLFLDGRPIDQSKIKYKSVSKARLDTSFSEGSKIDTIILSKQRINNLAKLCQVWGIMKYHHASVCRGNYNMDAELFKILPSIIKAKSNLELSTAVERWVDKFGLSKTETINSHISRGQIIERPDYGSIFNDKIFEASLVNKLKKILSNQDTSSKYYIELANGVGNPLFKNEIAYETMKYPDAGYRLLSLFRYWNMIQYFYPYKHLIGSNWNDELYQFIPAFLSARDKTEYVLTSLLLISKIHDTHANIWQQNEILESYRGEFQSPFEAKFVEDKLVVTNYYIDTLDVRKKINVGDIILGIDGKNIPELIKKHLPLSAGSNYASQLRDMPRNFLLRTNKKLLSITVLRDKKIQTLSINTVEHRIINQRILNDSKHPEYTILDKNIGYLYPGKYRNEDLPKIEEAFWQTKGIIVDMRCYPSDFMPFTFVPFIKTGNSSFAKFAVGSMENPGQFTIKDSVVNTGKNIYRGKVVVIVNEETQSQAEYTTMAFQSSDNVIVIGSTTAGADGNVSSITLPGGIKTMISGVGIYYPNGRETQRKGVFINYRISPSINGIKLGEDEVLKKALDILNK